MAELDVKAAVEELRKANEKLDNGEKNVGELKGKIAAMETKLEANEAENQKLVAKIAMEEKSRREMEEKQTELEKQLRRLPNGSEKETKANILRVFEKFMQSGISGLTADELKTLRPANPAQSDLIANQLKAMQVKSDAMQTSVDPDGGYLAPPEYAMEILKKITLISPIRAFARVRTVTAPELRNFRRDTLVSSYWTGEAQDFTPSKSAYGLVNTPLHSLTGEVQVTTRELFNSAFNVESEINLDLAEEFARKESEAFVNGDGNVKPRGIIVDPNVESFNSGVANDITFDNFHTLFGAIKTGYKPMYGSTRKTIGRIRKLKDGVGQYLWQQGNVAAGIPNTINGEPYIEIPHMDEIGAGLTPVVYGDFSRGYQIVDSLAMTVLRNPYRKSGFVYFTAERFVGGNVVMPEAIKKLKCAA